MKIDETKISEEKHDEDVGLIDETKLEEEIRDGGRKNECERQREGNKECEREGEGNTKSDDLSQSSVNRDGIESGEEGKQMKE